MSVGSRRVALLDALVAALGGNAVQRDPAAVARSLKDNSWLSPILSEHFAQRHGDDDGIVADAVVTPATTADLRQTIALAVQHDAPMTLRGGGTTNFGQSLPLHGGIVIDVRRLNRMLKLTDASATAEGGALQGDVDRAAREFGREMTILPTTSASATLAGWVAGGHLGLGGATYGTTWDGNVLGVSLLTAEDEPREIVLEGDDVYPVLRTYGTTGVITQVTVPLVAARTWLEAVIVFDQFDPAARFVQALAAHAEIAQRSVSAQEAPLAASFTPIKHLYSSGQAVVPAIFDAVHESEVRALVSDFGGVFHHWKTSGDGDRFPLAFMSYGHRMLWVKKVAPAASFLNCYFLPDRVFEQFRLLKERFGTDVWLEMKYNRSPWLRRLRGLPEGDGLLPAPLLTLIPGDRAFVESVMAFCDSIGVTYQNPHTFAIEESGVFPDVERIVRFARAVDPKGLLNPGKLGGTFFGTRAGKSGADAP
jgi:FAD/FMN-containing dehydrogenase